MTMIGGWGRYPMIDANIHSFASEEEAAALVRGVIDAIPRGLGRSYGDSSLAENILLTLRMNRFLSFDENSGLLACEAGVSLAEILEIFVPRGWFLPVTPGTKFVTVGGAIASDVHGKNHHVDGSFSDHVVSFDLMLPDGKIVSCSRRGNTDLFRATAGGMGLTGIILRASFHLKRVESAYIRQRSVRAQNLNEIMDLFESHRHYTMSMAWIDCLSGGRSLGRSIMMVGEHATARDCDSVGITSPLHPANKLKLNVPIDFPAFALNSLSVRAFNQLYYSKHLKRVKEGVIPYDPFFYPLDSIHNWNRIYGKRGFTQYQFVLPNESSAEGLRDILKRIAKSGMGSFLAVLKQFGKGNANYISFPKAGYTLALDFAIDPYLFRLLDELDKMVLNYGGRIYLTKDVRMKHYAFVHGYPDLNKFLKIVHKYNRNHRFESLQSKRLEI
jgi:FAD/FMN-containing dehydrogenase